MKPKAEEFARVFPHAKGIAWRFPSLETWLEQNYTPVLEPAAVNLGGYRLWRRKDASAVEVSKAPERAPRPGM